MVEGFLLSPKTPSTALRASPSRKSGRIQVSPPSNARKLRPGMKK